jgi:hypothetical protein
MKFNVGQQVKLTEDADFGSDHLSKGAKGEVKAQKPLGTAYEVKFESLSRNVTVVEDSLEAA